MQLISRMMHVVAGAMLLIVLIVFGPAEVKAAPSLSDCRSIAKVCVEPDETRRINGQDVHAACWRWKDTWNCARPRPHATQCTNVKRSRSCSRTGRTCISRTDGVCEKWRVTWHCTAKQRNPGQATLTSERYRIRSDRIVSGCTAQENRQDCRRVSRDCISGPATRNFKELDVTRSCWQWRDTYECLGETMNDDCGPLESDANCSLEADECLATGPYGKCINEERVYRCGTDSEGTVSQSCGAAAWCIDGDCTDMARQPPNQSFGRAAAAMNLLQEMGKDFAFNGSNLAIFRGEKMSCSKWVLGLKNCCKTSGLLLDADLAECKESEKKLAEKRVAQVTWHVRSYCKNKTFFGLCTVKAEDHCAFKSRLGRMLQEQARGQLGIGRDSCRGLTVAEIERVDWDRVDLSEVLGDIEARLQPVEATRMKSAMKARIGNYYKRIKSGRIKSGLAPGNPADNSTEGP